MGLAAPPPWVPGGEVQVHQNHFHQKPLSSKTTFIKNQFHQKPIPVRGTQGPRHLTQTRLVPTFGVWGARAKGTSCLLKHEEQRKKCAGMGLDNWSEVPDTRHSWTYARRRQDHCTACWEKKGQNMPTTIEEPLVCAGTGKEQRKRLKYDSAQDARRKMNLSCSSGQGQCSQVPGRDLRKFHKLSQV